VEGRQTFANRAVKRLLGYEVNEILGVSVFDLMHPEDSKRYRICFQKASKKKTSWKDSVVRWKHKNGSVRFFETTGQPILDPEGNLLGFSGIDRDITARMHAEQEKRKLETQLLQAQKMEAIGTLAGGLAHDFNNLLQVIQGYGELLLIQKKETDPDYEKIQEVLHSAKRGSELIRKLLTFSRKVESEKRPLDLNREAVELRNLLERTIPKMIDIQLHLADDLKIVNVDSVQIEQVVMNIAVNAKDAMPEGGTLSISTENTTLTEPFCRTHAITRPGD